MYSTYADDKRGPHSKLGVDAAQKRLCLALLGHARADQQHQRTHKRQADEREPRCKANRLSLLAHIQSEANLAQG
jgi:hypothetical protein